jgi:hypothetical protein
MFLTMLTDTYSDAGSGNGLLVAVGIGLIVAFLIAGKLVSVVVGMLNAFVQLAMTLGTVALIVGGVGIFAGLLTLYNAAQGSTY